MKTAFERSEPDALTLVNIDRPAAFRLEARRGESHERAITNALDAGGAASPKIPLSILEKRGYEDGRLRAACVQNDSAGVNTNQASRRAQPDVGVAIPNHGKNIEMAKGGRNFHRSNFGAVPTQYALVGTDP